VCFAASSDFRTSRPTAFRLDWLAFCSLTRPWRQQRPRLDFQIHFSSVVSFGCEAALSALCLKSAFALTLIGLWLIASEDETHQGSLPDVRKLAFRLRTSETKMCDALKRLSHWLIQDDIAAISDGFQSDAPETETERETKKRRVEADATPTGFAEFWSTYPKKAAKPAAIKAWKKIKEEEIQPILKDIEFKKSSPSWTKDGGQFVPNPATYLNQRRWEDSGGAIFGAKPALNKQEALEARNREVVARMLAKEGFDETE